MKLCITILKYHSLVVFMPTQITTNHAITYTNCESRHQIE